nr:carbamoyltransferase HypF [Acidimicrobiia bacterium]
ALERTDGPLVLDPAPLVAAVLVDRDRGVDRRLVAAGFHEGIGRAGAEAAVVLARQRGLDSVALTGGVFQNARLTEVVETALRAAGLEVLVHRSVPANDGGISIGQAAVAAARGAEGGKPTY